jgi:hypothetical protein
VSTFLRKNIAFGVASALAAAVGMKFWELLAAASAGLAPGAFSDGVAVAEGVVAFVLGAGVFVKVYMYVNEKLEEMSE